MADSMLPDDVVALAARVIAENRAIGRKITLAESCTGGLVAAALTEIAGSSAVLDRGFVTYSNESKRDVLGVPEDILDTFGAVSAATAWAMAQGALKKSGADVAVAISGIAGPDGGSEHKPVGLVHWAVASASGTEQRERVFIGGRDDIRRRAVFAGLDLIRRGLTVLARQ